MKNPESFQGEKYLTKNKNYFEGWYFKNSNAEEVISFIPGIHINDKERKAFIQIITNHQSYYVNYKLQDFIFHVHPFFIQIKNNVFSKRGIILDIEDKKQDLKVQGALQYNNHQNIQKNGFQPNIMGPFSYIPFMECNHAILCMCNSICGHIDLNENRIEFENGIGYIEKDWGCSFPKSYVWCQGNHFMHSNASFMLSIAEIPFKILNFRGFLCILIIDKKEYRFATYNHARIIRNEVSDKNLHIRLQRKSYTLDIQSYYENAHELNAPVDGKMDKIIYESISACIRVTLKKDENILFSDISDNCGLEIV